MVCSVAPVICRMVGSFVSEIQKSQMRKEASVVAFEVGTQTKNKKGFENLDTPLNLPLRT
jgi:hypothetical protein